MGAVAQVDAMGHRGVWVLGAVAASCLIGCTSGDVGAGGAEEAQVCNFDLDCEAGFRCREGVCVSFADLVGDEPEAQPESGEPEGGEPEGGEPEGECQPALEVCDGSDNDCDGQIDEGVQNACGGCAALAQEPGVACGECGGGRAACQGVDAVVCQGAAPRNACGGCAALTQAPGASCGVCGQVACEGVDAIKCEDRAANACGGCAQLSEAPGQACGACGQTECSGQDAVVCNDPGEEACSVVRFVAIGDTGEGNDKQYRVSEGVQARCDRGGGCEGFIMLGDNIYDEGAQSPTDSQFTTKIDMPYRNLKKGPPPGEGQEDLRERMPIYASLGNHDLGGAGLNSAQVANYLAYARANPWFIYPDEFYDVQVGPVHLMSIHTNPLAYLGLMMEPQGQMVQDVVRTTSATWTIVFGHHPYRSDGRHGNAGAYEGIPGDLLFLGGMFRVWVEEYVCNQVDFYLAGHDHNRQWMEEVPDIPSWPPWAENRVPCRTHFAVSGAGAKTTDLEGRGNALAFGAETLGFLWMEFHRDYAVVEFCGADGDTEWTRTIMR